MLRRKEKPQDPSPSSSGCQMDPPGAGRQPGPGKVYRAEPAGAPGVGGDVGRDRSAPRAGYRPPSRLQTPQPATDPRPGPPLACSVGSGTAPPPGAAPPRPRVAAPGSLPARLCPGRRRPGARPGSSSPLTRLPRRRPAPLGSAPRPPAPASGERGPAWAGGQRPPRPVPPRSRPSGTAWARPGRERRPPRVPAPHKALCPRLAAGTLLAAASPLHPRPGSAPAERLCLRDIPAGIRPRGMQTPTHPAAPHRSHRVLPRTHLAPRHQP